MTTEDIAKWLIDKPRTSYNIPKIMNANPLNLPEIELPIDPYVLEMALSHVELSLI